MPGTKLTDEDHRKIDAKFICTSCKSLLNIPMQTMCGHLMCQSCVENLLKSSNPKCPEDGEELSKEKVFPDVFTKRELNAIPLHCANPGCSWRGAYEQLEGHSQVCEHALIKCVHPQCQMKLQRSHLGEHLKSECEYRNVKCVLCGQDVTFALIMEHVDTSCEGAPVTCRYCKEDVLRKDIERHERHDCNEAPATCEFQAVGCNHVETLRRNEIRQHMNDGLIDHVRLLLQYILTFVTQLGNYIPRPEFNGIIQRIRDDISEVRFSLAEKFAMVVRKFTDLDRRLENKFTGIERRFEYLESRLESQRDPRAQQVIHSHNGTLLWKIESYQRKRQDAINEVKTALCSPPFYSSQFGFKMCAILYMNGNGIGKGSHFSLFFAVMKGDYEALQTWPFEKTITMMLLDQGNGDHMIDAFHSDPQSASFQRPTSYMNIASGSPLFMPFHKLNDHQYIKDDVMYIKIIVD
ncbi:TNF receptor-associated factor 2 isoform X1 [Paramuricea clavata]|uniref:TNF receptor-associated factor 2 isoform X1 n=1 Tax=Paramuricea clavata TaxID=317549 RepID=A0A6S7KFZ0_PARCT|nr:TNF receptor-associated factor 2 isoform X1 [Paramuricea clavata]